jgi:hypothetical protein
VNELLLVLKVLAACVGGVLLLFAFVYTIGLGLRRAEPYLERRRQEALRHPPGGNLFWPKFPSPESARVYCLAASGIAFLFAVLYALAGWFQLFGYGAWVWFFSAAFVAGGFAVRRGMRSGAVLVLASYAALAGFQLAVGSFPHPTLLAFGPPVFIGTLRATLVLHRPRGSTAAA